MEMNRVMFDGDAGLAIDGLDDDQLFKLYTECFEGCDENILKMGDFRRLLSRAEQCEVIGQFVLKFRHFDYNDAYVSFKYGSTNDRMKYVDKKALRRRLIEEADNED